MPTKTPAREVCNAARPPVGTPPRKPAGIPAESTGSDAAPDSRQPPCRCAHPRCASPHVYLRGLCRKCYRDPRVRAKHAHRPWDRSRALGCPWEYDPAPVSDPARRTLADPGSTAKVLVMVERRQAGRALFHPADAGACPVALEAALVEMVVRSVPGIERDRERAGETRRGRFRARPRHPKTGRRVNLGYWPDKVQAALAIVEWRKAGCPVAGGPTPTRPRPGDHGAVSPAGVRR